MYFAIRLSLTTSTPCSLFCVHSLTLRVASLKEGEARKCKDIQKMISQPKYHSCVSVHQQPTAQNSLLIIMQPFQEKPKHSNIFITSLCRQAMMMKRKKQQFLGVDKYQTSLSVLTIWTDSSGGSLLDSRQSSKEKPQKRVKLFYNERFMLATCTNKPISHNYRPPSTFLIHYSLLPHSGGSLIKSIKLKRMGLMLPHDFHLFSTGVSAKEVTSSWRWIFERGWVVGVGVKLYSSGFNLNLIQNPIGSYQFLMGKQLLIASLVSLAILAVYYTAQENKLDAFEEWKGQFGANWAAEEEGYRRLIFEKNLVLINKHNADASQTYKMGVNQFSIYTTEEFATRFLTPMPLVGFPQGDNEYEVIGDIDWTAKGGVSPVKNQGGCGSCWAFSATGVMESVSLVKGRGSVNLSEQQLVDCSRPQGNQGCNGGWPSSALNYVKANGITTESAYGYIGKDQACKTQGGSFKISGYTSASGCAGLTNSINASPVSVTVDATNWSPYKSGVFSNCASGINHAVLLVGVVGGSWKIKNSWGTGWGESGFIRLNTGNTCGVCAYAGVVPTL